MRELAPERRRRLIFRALPAVGVIAVIAFAAGLMVGSGAPSTAERTAGRLRPGLAARRPAGHARDARRALAQLLSAAGVQAGIPALGGHGHHDPGGGGRARGRARRLGRGAGVHADPGVRPRPGTPPGAGAATIRWPGRPASPSPAYPPARAFRGRAAPRCERRSSPATARSWPRGRPTRAPPRSEGSRPRSRASSSPSRREQTGTASTHAGSRATGRSGETGSSARSSIGCPAVPEAC